MKFILMLLFVVGLPLLLCLWVRGRLAARVMALPVLLPTPVQVRLRPVRGHDPGRRRSGQ